MVGWSISQDQRRQGGQQAWHSRRIRILSGNGAAISNTETLRFTGDASSIALGDPSATLHHQMTDGNRDMISFAVTATDSGGNDVTTIPSVNPVVTDPDGRRVAPGSIDAKQVDHGDVKNARVQVVNKVASPSSLKAGEYTVTITSGSNKATQTFMVAGDAAGDIDVDVETNTDEVMLGTLVTVSAAVADKAGTPVADGTKVDFTAAGALELNGVGDVTDRRPTKAALPRRASLSVRARPCASIIVTSGDASGTSSVRTDATAEAMPEEEASVSCLSNLSAFSTWTCGVDSSASEVFAMLEGRGVTAIHLHNGSAWVRYSVVEGNTVPGSSDFMVTEDDILYISN